MITPLRELQRILDGVAREHWSLRLARLCREIRLPAVPALDARAVPEPVPRPEATTESVLWTGAWSPARIPARRRPTL